MYNSSASLRASIRSLLLPSFSKAIFRGLHTTSSVTVQPASPGAFFKRELQIATQPVDKLQNGARFGLDDTFHHHLAGEIQNCDRNAFLVHVHADIFSSSHRGCSFL